jgi:AmmeMemoRadiSam system protein B
MSKVLASLRRHLDLMPSPLPDTPGLVIRDPFRYAEAMLVLPPPLIPCLMLFDGGHDEGDLRVVLSRITDSVEVGELANHLADTLSANGFLQDDVFDRLRDARHAAFAAGERREAVHAGSGYPDDATALRDWAVRYLADAPEAVPETGTLMGIAAPHVSPDGGWRSYGAAYSALTPDLRDRTFVILGTSHYGMPGRFGLTRKPFATPFGVTAVDTLRVDALAAAGGPAVVVEDYCHAVEHSIEFQVVFLQHLYGAGVRILPILCGPLGAGAGRPAPRDDVHVQQFLAALSTVCAPDHDVFWILGIDMAHIGQRYGHGTAVVAGEGPMRDVAEQDRARCRRIAAGDPDALWELVEADGEGDPLQWCGSSPAYAFLAAARPGRGALRHYEQWNIDPGSVVSFAGMAFYR